MAPTCRGQPRAVRCFGGGGATRAASLRIPPLPPVKLPRAPLQFRQEPAQHAPIARISPTHAPDASPFAGKAAAIEERVKGMGPDKAQAAREKAAEDARKRGA